MGDEDCDFGSRAYIFERIIKKSYLYKNLISSRMALSLAGLRWLTLFRGAEANPALRA
jgi:hypothetical protein